MDDKILNVFVKTGHHVKESGSHDISKMEVFDIFIIAMLVFVMVIGVTGNTVVIYVFGISRRKKRFDRFLLALGILDFLSSILIPLTFLYLTATRYKRWDFGEIGCKVIPTLLQITVSVTQGVLIMISYERYHSIVNPFQEKVSHFMLITLFCTVLSLSIILAVPYMMTFHILVNFDHGIKTCTPDGSKTKLLMAASSLQLTRDVIAISFMEFFRQRISKSLLKTQSHSSWDCKRETQKGRKILFIVIIVFSSLTLPLDIFQFIFYLFVNFSTTTLNSKTYEVFITVNTILNLIQMSNSVVNVFIYSRMHKNFNLKQKDASSCGISDWNGDKNVKGLFIQR